MAALYTPHGKNSDTVLEFYFTDGEDGWTEFM
jgi:hypothetical protein